MIEYLLVTDEIFLKQIFENRQNTNYSNGKEIIFL
jgi:hypothetical protein